MAEHGRAPREMAVLLAQWASIGHKPTPTSAVRRAHAVSARAALPPERGKERARSGAFSCAHTQVSCLLEAAAGMSEHGRALSGVAVQLAQWAFIRYKPTPTIAARRAHAASARAALPQERESARAVALFFSCAHAQVSCLLEAAAGMSEHSRAPRGVAVQLAQWASMGHGSSPTSAAGRAHAVSARAALPP